VAGTDFVEPRLWHASLPGVIVAAAALIRDDDGSVLIVKPNYRDYWTLPGGVCELGESPQAGCAREVAEEVGLRPPVGRLLAVDWQPPPADYGPDARPSMYFIFDGGRHSGGADGIVLQQDELDDFRFAPPGELAGYLAGSGLRRAMAAIVSLASGVTRYLPHEPG
jgi:8-oxo-dGTP diphosphatase